MTVMMRCVSSLGLLVVVSVHFLLFLSAICIPLESVASLYIHMFDFVNIFWEDTCKLFADLIMDFDLFILRYVIEQHYF